MVRGSLSKITFCSKVRGYYSPPCLVFQLLSFFQISRLISYELILNLFFLTRLLSNLLIIIMGCLKQRMTILLLILLVLVFAQDRNLDRSRARLWENKIVGYSYQNYVSQAMYVSSWSSEGRKMAIKYAHKFQSIILCLYDLRFQERRFHLQKVTEIQSSFIKQLRKANPSIKVILRIYVCSSARAIFEYVSSSTKKIADLSQDIVKVMRKQKANGILYDSVYNLPIRALSVDSYGPYDKFAILLNSYILNQLAEDLSKREILIYNINVNPWNFENIDFQALKMIKTNGVMIESIDGKYADLFMKKSLAIAKQIRSFDSNIQIFFTTALFSWRNDIGIKTPTSLKYMERGGMIIEDGNYGWCIFKQIIGGVLHYISCANYLNFARKVAYEHNISLAFFEAGDACEEQMQLL